MSIFVWIENGKYGFSIMKDARVIYTCQPQFLSRESAEERARAYMEELT